MADDQQATISGIHHISVTVSDVEASAAWYEQVFGASRIPITFAHHDCEDTGYAVLLIEPGSGLVIGLQIAVPSAYIPKRRVRPTMEINARVISGLDPGAIPGGSTKSSPGYRRKVRGRSASTDV